MNNEINEAMQIISKVFPVSYAYTDSTYKHFHTSTSGIKRIVCDNANREEWTAELEPRVEMEMAQIETEKHDALNVIKLTSNGEGSLRKFSLFIDISRLNVKTTRVDSKSEYLLFNSKFITAYMRLSHREKQILKQLSMMKTSEEIAETLFISSNTVKSHKKSIRKKVAFATREEHSRFLCWVRGYVS